jgi:hypothetical protein
MKLWLEDRDGDCIVATGSFQDIQSPIPKGQTERILDCLCRKVRMNVWELDGTGQRFDRLFSDAVDFIGDHGDVDILDGFDDIQKSVIHAKVLEDIAEAARAAFSWACKSEPIDEEKIIWNVINEVSSNLDVSSKVAA